MTLKTISDDSQNQIFDSYESNQTDIKSKYSSRYSISQIEIMDSPENKKLLMAYWVNFKPVIMPQTDVVVITIGEGEKPENYSTYMISQTELFKILGAKVKKQIEPINLFTIDKIDSLDTINKITSNSIDLE